MKKRRKFFILLIILGFFFAIFSYGAARSYTNFFAKKKALDLIETALPEGQSLSSDEEVLRLARAVFNVFQEKDPSSLWPLQLRPYLTSKQLPEFLRFQDGAIGSIVQAGLCDNAVRMLKFILAERGYPSVQWNIVSNVAMHSALQVSLPNGRTGFLDPFYGFAAIREGRLISMKEAQEDVRQGREVFTILQAFGEKSRPEFYKNFPNMRMAAEGEPLIISVDLPELEKGSVLEIGKVDGQFEDVQGEGARLGLTPLLHYVGHKYNREWIREIKTSQNVQVNMTLVDHPREGVLVATPRPEEEEKVLRWNLKAGEKIIFRDGEAKRSFIRMNSFLEVDHISVIRMD